MALLMEAPITYTEAFDLAYRFVTETNLNIFLTGKAGTGKTTFLKYLRQHSFKKILVAAPTGVAAINAGGVTLHSLFQLPFTPFIPAKDSSEGSINSHSLVSQVRYNRDKINLFRNLELLVIDEASMVASYTVDAIDTLLRSVRRAQHLPFGGVQVLFIGDLYQLPPVVKNEQWAFLKNYYSSVFFFDSLVLKQHIPVVIELKTIFRQQDSTFIGLLNEIRNNDVSQESAELLHTRLKKDFSTDDEGYITLTTHNYQADEINKRKLQKLTTPSQTYLAEINGDFPENLYPADMELVLKEGAQVMFLKNDTEEKKYFNGKIGVVTGLEDNKIYVQCKGEQNEIEVKKYEWKNTRYTLNTATREIVEEELGGFEQYPLCLAWAITIHKSQGLTFDKLIIDAEKAFANGQTYVALSRCRSLEGLVLTSPLNNRYLGASQNLIDWNEKNHDKKDLKQKFDESRQDYIALELQHIFTWKNWAYELNELNAILIENKGALPEQCYTWIMDLIEKQRSLQMVADKFKERMISLLNENPSAEENQPLQQRIKDAATYFSAEIAKWSALLFSHPITTDTKKIGRAIDEALNEINIIVHDISYSISFCKNGFLLNDYLKSGKKPTASAGRVPSSYAQDKVSGNNEHMILYNRLNAMRRKSAEEMRVPVYRVFRNVTMEKICASLPGTMEDLLNIEKISKAKMKQYGEEIIDIVRQYCREKGIEPKQVISTKGKSRKTINTVDETLRIFKSGKTIAEIAQERNFAISTIEGHLAEAISKGLISIEEVMPMTEVQTISAYFTQDGKNVSLTGIKERVPKDVSYGKLRMVLAWLQK